ncbi:MAG: ATP-dependent DNA helicase RecG [Cryobacterium sp.]|nr:ATP-dependent DNA helicase RecG [Cryobacterium sp.]
MIRVTLQRYPLNVTSQLEARLSTVLGGRTSAALNRGLGLQTVGDLLAHYPRRYAHRGELTALATLPLEENVTMVAEVLGVKERSMRSRKGNILEVTITDGSGLLTLTFFNQPWRVRDLKPGVRGIFAGKVSEYKGSRQLAHPDYELFDEDDSLHGTDAKTWASTPIPIYPATSTVASWQLQKSIAVVLDTLGDLADPLPPEVAAQRRLLDFRTALEKIHRPTEDADWKAARSSLRFQEAFLLQLALLEQRAVIRSQEATSRSSSPGGLLEQFDARLEFTLTSAQTQVGLEVAKDLAGSAPMNRLLQGEVGSGKTLVALRAMLTVAESGGQSALLAPTEVLAAQHLRSIARILGPELSAKLRPTLITGGLSVAERRKATLATVTGDTRIVVGTHALLSENVEFFDLGLVVIDEQHRFGVEQREKLRLKGTRPPHVLVLTATPIPRTVAMTVFGDLEISTIAELPAGRAGIESFVVPLAEKPSWGDRIWQRIAEEVAAGRQAFVVCPAIDPSHSEGELEDAEGGSSTVVEMLEALRKNPALKSARIEAVHGRLPSEEKDSIMRAFAEGAIDVLVATTVIEVGVDVPNATVMAVMDADRFGVSQLHQLRGRVGRGSAKGLCLLVTSALEGTLGRERVEAVAATLDGFELAQKDLELRKEGDVLGSLQSGGRSSLKLLRVIKDADLILDARKAAESVLASDPKLAGHPALRQALDRRLDPEERDFLSKS